MRRCPAGSIAFVQARHEEAAAFLPPIPPHVSMAQVRNYVKAMAKGDPDAAGVVRAMVKELFA